MTDYQPLSCDLHDELEVAALRGKPVRLQWQDADGTARQAMAVIRDIEVTKAGEFLLFAVDNEPLRIRLDQIDLNSFPLC